MGALPVLLGEVSVQVCPAIRVRAAGGRNAVLVCGRCRLRGFIVTFLSFELNVVIASSELQIALIRAFIFSSVCLYFC